MINYTRKNEVWSGKDLSKVDPAERQRVAELPADERAAAFAALREQVAVEVDAETESELEALYEQHRPEVPEGGTYEFVAMDVVGSTRAGVLNCRVNGQHIQVRF